MSTNHDSTPADAFIREIKRCTLDELRCAFDRFDDPYTPEQRDVLAFLIRNPSLSPDYQRLGEALGTTAAEAARLTRELLWKVMEAVDRRLGGTYGLAQLIVVDLVLDLAREWPRIER